jgi:hypothetical protein
MVYWRGARQHGRAIALPLFRRVFRGDKNWLTLTPTVEGGVFWPIKPSSRGS